MAEEEPTFVIPPEARPGTPGKFRVPGLEERQREVENAREQLAQRQREIQERAKQLNSQQALRQLTPQQRLQEQQQLSLAQNQITRNFERIQEVSEQARKIGVTEAAVIRINRALQRGSSAIRDTDSPELKAEIERISKEIKFGKIGEKNIAAQVAMPTALEQELGMSLPVDVRNLPAGTDISSIPNPNLLFTPAPAQDLMQPTSIQPLSTTQQISQITGGRVEIPGSLGEARQKFRRNVLGFSEDVFRVGKKVEEGSDILFGKFGATQRQVTDEFIVPERRFLPSGTSSFTPQTGFFLPTPTTETQLVTRTEKTILGAPGAIIGTSLFFVPGISQAIFAGGAISGTATATDPSKTKEERIFGGGQAVLSGAALAIPGIQRVTKPRVTSIKLNPVSTESIAIVEGAGKVAKGSRVSTAIQTGEVTFTTPARQILGLKDKVQPFSSNIFGSSETFFISKLPDAKSTFQFKSFGEVSRQTFRSDGILKLTKSKIKRPTVTTGTSTGKQIQFARGRTTGKPMKPIQAQVRTDTQIAFTEIPVTVTKTKGGVPSQITLFEKPLESVSTTRLQQLAFFKDRSLNILRFKGRTRIKGSRSSPSVDEGVILIKGDKTLKGGLEIGSVKGSKPTKPVKPTKTQQEMKQALKQVLKKQTVSPQLVKTVKKSAKQAKTRTINQINAKQGLRIGSLPLTVRSTGASKQITKTQEQISQVPAQFLVQKPLQVQVQGEKQTTTTQDTTKVRPLQTPAPISRTAEDELTKINQGLKLAIAQASAQLQRPIQKQQTTPVSTTPISPELAKPRVPTIPGRPTPPIVPPPRPADMKKIVKKLRKQGKVFDVFVKRGRSYEKVADDLPIGRALKKGADVTRNTLAAQFKVVADKKASRRLKKKPKDIRFTPDSDRFRDYQIKGGKPTALPLGHFIERKNKRIGSGGEIKEILQAQKTGKPRRPRRRKRFI